MANKVYVKKGLKINLKGKAEERVASTISSEIISIVPDDYCGIVPKVAIKVGDRVLAGTPLFFDKNCPEITVASPVSGEVVDIVRGERRKVLSINIKADQTIEYRELGVKKMTDSSSEEIRRAITNAGLWWTITQRPYAVVANPNVAPRDIFITGFDSAPLSPNADFVFNGEFAALQIAVDALKKLTSGKVYFSISTSGSSLAGLKGVELVVVEGEHPAGNVGVQINALKPVNKGEVVWTISVFDLVLIGRLFAKGKVDMTRIISICGSEVVKPCYVKCILGAQVGEIVKHNVVKTDRSLRYISGNVLTGKKVLLTESLGAYDHQLTVIPEGDDFHEFVGWAMPGFDKFSVSNTFFTRIVNMLNKNKEYIIDARIRGGERGIIMSNEYDKVFPMDIFPEQLIKAIMAFNIEKMEKLGIYEVAPEDFALCEFVDTSKLEIQKIVREGLDRLRKELD